GLKTRARPGDGGDGRVWSSCLTPNWVLLCATGRRRRDNARGPDVSVRANEQIMEPIPQTRFGDARGGWDSPPSQPPALPQTLAPPTKRGLFSERHPKRCLRDEDSPRREDGGR